MNFKVVFTKQAKKDAKKVAAGNLKKKAEQLIEILRDDPFQSPPQFEKLVGELEGVYSRRINIRHRLIYQVFEKEKVVKVIRMWTHYGE